MIKNEVSPLKAQIPQSIRSEECSDVPSEPYPIVRNNFYNVMFISTALLYIFSLQS